MYRYRSAIPGSLCLTACNTSMRRGTGCSLGSSPSSSPARGSSQPRTSRRLCRRKPSRRPCVRVASAPQVLEEAAVVLGVLDQAHPEAGGAVVSGRLVGGPPHEAVDVERLAAVVAERERNLLALVRHLSRADEQASLGHVMDLATTVERPCLELCVNRGANASMGHAARFGATEESICEIGHVRGRFQS